MGHELKVPVKILRNEYIITQDNDINPRIKGQAVSRFVQGEPRPDGTDEAGFSFAMKNAGSGVELRDQAPP